MSVRRNSPDTTHVSSAPGSVPPASHSHAQTTVLEPPEPPSVETDLSGGGAAGRGFTAVLANRNFLVLWSAQILSQLADKVVLVLMISLISTHFQPEGDTISQWVSAVMFAFTLPAILFGTLAGVYVDRWSKQGVLVGTNLLRGILLLLLPLLILFSRGLEVGGGLPIGFLAMLVIVFLVSTLTQYFAPAEQATLPLIVSKQNLLTANSLYATTMMASVIVGFAVGEPLLNWANGLLPALLPIEGLSSSLVVGGAYGLASLVLLGLRPREERSRQEKAQQVWRDILSGIRYVGRNAEVRAALLQIVVLYSVFAALAVLAVRLAELTPALKTTQFGFLLAAAGLGMGLGAFVTGQLGHRLSRRQWALLGSLGLGGLLLVLGSVGHQLWIGLTVIGGIGFTGALAVVPMQTEIQDKTPKRLRGKVFGLQNNLANIALSLPLALAGVAEAALGLTPVLWGLGGITLISGLLTWRISAAQRGVIDS